MKLTYADIDIEYQKLIEDLNNCELSIIAAKEEYDRAMKDSKSDKVVKDITKKELEAKNQKAKIEEELKNYNLDLYKKAFKILEHSDPMEYLIDTYKMMHAGDITIGKVLILAVANTSINNSKGIQPDLGGESGKGKTHSARTIVKMIPKYYLIEGSLSAKSLFYKDDMIPGMIIFSDDIEMSDDLNNTMKRSMGEFQEDTPHNTLNNKTQKYIQKIIPKRTVWILTSVDSHFQDQLKNRQYHQNVDESPEMDKKVSRKIFDESVDKGKDEELSVNEKLEICQLIFTIIKKQLFKINIPFGKSIEWNAPGDRRNPDRFLSLVMGFTMLRYLQRNESRDGVLDATEQDFKDAKKIYEEGKENQITKLSKSELRLVKHMVKLGHTTSINEIVTEYKKENGESYTYQAIKKIVVGESYKNRPGLIDKIPGMIIEKTPTEYRYFIPEFKMFNGEIVSLKNTNEIEMEPMEV